MIVIAMCVILMAGQPMWAEVDTGMNEFGPVTSCMTGVGIAPAGACACPTKRGMQPLACQAAVVQADWSTQIGCEATYPFTVTSAIRWRKG